MTTSTSVSLRVYDGTTFLFVKGFTAESITLGRGPAAMLRIDNAAFNDLHAVINVGADGVLQLFGVGTTSNITLRGAQTSNATLKDGDEVTIGDIRIVVSVGAPAANPTPDRPAVTTEEQTSSQTSSTDSPTHLTLVDEAPSPAEARAPSSSKSLIQDVGLTPSDASAVQSLLQSPDETILGVLGQGWLGSLIAGSGFSKAVFVVTDQHLYLKGKMYVKTILPNGAVQRQLMKRDLVVALEDVHSSEVLEVTTAAFKNFIVLGIFGFIVFVSFLFSESFGVTMLVIMMVLSVPLMINTIVLLIRGNQKELSVHYGASVISVPVKWYTEDEVNRFRRQITRAASDSRKGNHRPAPAAAPTDGKVCPYCAETIKKQAIKCRYCGSAL